LQAQLDQFSSGVQVVGVSVEAIHPPPGAAGAYHDVQAAEIRANSLIAERRADASRSLGGARQKAEADRDAALATAAARVGEARAQGVQFAADEQAWRRGGTSFLLERWLQNMESALARGDFVMIDHRLSGRTMPTIDLRQTANGAAPLTPQELQAQPPASEGEQPPVNQNEDED
jgi:regulator of protease activity HflC (stomatin/prohibitin superfamily)